MLRLFRCREFDMPHFGQAEHSRAYAGRILNKQTIFTTVGLRAALLLGGAGLVVGLLLSLSGSGLTDVILLSEDIEEVLGESGVGHDYNDLGTVCLRWMASLLRMDEKFAKREGLI